MTTPQSIYDSSGLSMNRYSEILARLIEKAVEWKGESLSTDEEEVLGHLFRNLADEIDDVNWKVQSVFDAMSVANSTGTTLDNILELINLPRQSAAKSTATVTLTAIKAATFPSGNLVKTATNVYFATDEEVVFAGAGTSDVGVTCTEYGAYNAGIGEINTIVNNENGVTGVTNAAAAIPGRARETDAEIKLRHTIAVATSGERDAASISEAMGNVTGVSASLIVEDYVADKVNIYVIGGSDDDVAAAIDSQLTIGIGPILDGTTTVDVYNATVKQDREIKFTRGADVPIYIDLAIQVTGLFPADGDLQIKTAMETLFDGQNLGDDVVYTRLPGAVYQIPGAIISTLFVGTAPSPTGTTDLTMSNTQRATIDSANITITHV